VARHAWRGLRDLGVCLLRCGRGLCRRRCRPAPRAALEKQAVGYLQHGFFPCDVLFFKCDVDQIHIDDLALQSGFVAAFQKLNVIAQPERVHNPDQYPAKNIGKYTPCGKKCNSRDRGKPSQRGPQHFSIRPEYRSNCKQGGEKHQARGQSADADGNVNRQ